MNKTKTLLVVLLILAATASAFAQSLTGSVEGIVKDESGGALPGASVTLTGKTGARSAVTDAAGKFRFLAVSPGAYEISATLAGFQAVKKNSLQLTIGQNLTVDFGLKVSTGPRPWTWWAKRRWSTPRATPPTTASPRTFSSTCRSAARTPRPAC